MTFLGGLINYQVGRRPWPLLILKNLCSCGWESDAFHYLSHSLNSWIGEYVWDYYGDILDPEPYILST